MLPFNGQLQQSTRSPGDQERARHDHEKLARRESISFSVHLFCTVQTKSGLEIDDYCDQKVERSAVGKVEDSLQSCRMFICNAKCVCLAAAGRVGEAGEAPGRARARTVLLQQQGKGSGRAGRRLAPQEVRRGRPGEQCCCQKVDSRFIHRAEILESDDVCTGSPGFEQCG